MPLRSNTGSSATWERYPRLGLAQEDGDFTAEAPVRRREGPYGRAGRPLSTRRMLRRFYRPWYVRPFTWLVALLLVAVAARVALTPWLVSRTKQALAASPRYDASFGELRLFMFPPVMVLDRVRVEDRTTGNVVLAADRVEVHLPWSEVRRPQHVVRVRVRRPVWVAGAQAPISWRELLAGVPASRIEVMSVERGEVHRPDGRAVLTNVDATVTGAATDPALTAGEVRVDAHGGFLGGRFATKLTATSGGRELAGTVEVRDLGFGDVESLGGADGAARGRGAMDVLATVKLAAGALSGSVQTVSSSAQVETAPDVLAARFAETFTPIVPEVVARVDAEGRLSGSVAPPEPGVVDAMIGVTRAVAVAGVELGLQALAPPPEQAAAAATDGEAGAAAP